MKLWRHASGGLTPIILLAGAVALGALLARGSIARRAAAEEATQRQAVATTTATKGKFEIVVECRGKLEAVNSKPVMTEVTGQVVYLVPNGVRVKEGDVIAELDVPRLLRRVRDQRRQYDDAEQSHTNKTRDLEADVKKARIALEQAKAELEQYRAQQAVELAEKRSAKEQDTIELETAKRRFERQEGLAEQGLVPQREVELASTDLKAKEFALERESKDLELAEAQNSSEELDKQAAVTEAESALAQAESKRDAELRSSATTLEIRKSQLDRVEEEFSKSVIRAPADGIVVLEQEGRGGMQQRPLQPGDQVWQGRPIATIPDLSEMRVVVELPQDKARSVKADQLAVITVDAIQGVSFEGEMTEVSQTAGESTIPGTGIPSAERMFPAKVSINDLKGAGLRPGMTANVRIIVEELGEVVSIPLECVFEREDRRLVYVRRGQDFLPLEVELGEQSKGTAVVIKGLEGGEEIALRSVGDERPLAEAPPGPASSSPIVPQGGAQ